MSQITENLEKHYSVLNSEQGQYHFFVVLYDYVNYITDNPVLKIIANQAIKQKDKEYAKLNKLEEKAHKELNSVKTKLLQIIKDKKIDPDSIRHEVSMGGFDNGNVLQTMNKLESGQMYIGGGYSSGTQETYLLDIANAIAKQGYDDLLKEFIIPNKPSNNIYLKYPFFFSQTLELRRNQVGLIENALEGEIWADFNHLLKFQAGFTEKLKNTGLQGIWEKYGEKSRNTFDAGDVIDIGHVPQDIKRMLDSKNYHPHISGLHYLKVENFKLHATRVHNYILRQLEKGDFKQQSNGGTKTLKQKPLEYKMVFNGNSIMVNNYKLVSKMHFNRQVEKVVTYIFANPDKPISIEDIESYWKGFKITRSLSKILNDLGISKQVRKAFFSKVSGKAGLFFQQTVTSQELKDKGINEQILVKQLEYLNSQHTTSDD